MSEINEGLIAKLSDPNVPEWVHFENNAAIQDPMSEWELELYEEEMQLDTSAIYASNTDWRYPNG